MDHTVEKMGHIWKNGSDCKTWVTFGKMRQTVKNRSHLEKWDKLRKIRHINFLKIGSRCKTMSHRVNNGSNLEKCVTLKYGIHFKKMGYNVKKSVTYGEVEHIVKRMGHILKNVSYC